MQSRVITLDDAAIDRLAGPWRAILESCSNGVAGLDATCSSTWAKAVLRTHLRDAGASALLVESGAVVSGLMPVFRHPAGSGRQLRLITETTSGRSGMLATADQPALVEAMLRGAMTMMPRWDSLVLSVVEGSAGDAALRTAVDRMGVAIRNLGVRESPYIELPDSWEALLAGLPKKMRWTIRKGESELHARGRLDYEFLTDPSLSTRLVQAVKDVERRSWKEGASSSITSNTLETRFYEALCEVAAESGNLSGHVLTLDGQPIAYILGLEDRDGVFLDLKESFDSSYAPFAPGHVLKRFALDTLIQRGVRTYDFMGACEPYKMRWTARTYRRLGIAVYNRTLGGRIAHWRARAGAAVRETMARRMNPDQAPARTERGSDRNLRNSDANPATCD